MKLMNTARTPTTAVHLLTTLSTIVAILGASTHLYLFTAPAYDALTNAHSHNPDAHEFSRGTIAFFLGDNSALPSLNERERTHLYDVRTLIRTLAFLYTASLLFLLWTADRMSATRCARTAGLTIIALGTLGALIPFDTLFTSFHALFFAPTTWTFPADSILILTYPQAFFTAFFTLIMRTALAISAILVLCSFIPALRTRMLNHNKP